MPEAERKLSGEQMEVDIEQKYLLTHPKPSVCPSKGWFSLMTVKFTGSTEAEAKRQEEKFYKQTPNRMKCPICGLKDVVERKS